MARCGALTTEGYPCKRNAGIGSKYCFNHQDKSSKIGTYIGITGVILGILIGLILGPFWADTHYFFGEYKSVTGEPLDTFPPRIESKNLTNGSEYYYGDLKEINIEYFPQGKTSINHAAISLELFHNNKEIKSDNIISEKNDLTISLDPLKEKPFPVGTYRLKIAVPNMSGVYAEKDLVFEIMSLPKTNLFVSLGNTLQGLQNNYLSLYLENIGDVDLTNLLIETSTCYMITAEGNNYFETAHLQRLSKGKSREIEFKNNKTIERFKEKTCKHFTDFYSPAFSFGFDPFKIISNEKPDQNILGCGYCDYRIKVSSDQKNFEPIIDVIRAPKLYNVKIDSNYSSEDSNTISNNFCITPLE